MLNDLLYQFSQKKNNKLSFLNSIDIYAILLLFFYTLFIVIFLVTEKEKKKRFMYDDIVLSSLSNFLW